MLSKSKFLVKERIGFLKLSDTYDIFDPDSGVQVGIARETIHPLLKTLRLLVNKQLLPTSVEVRDHNEQLLFSIKKGPQFLRAKIRIFDNEGNEAGYFKSKVFSLGGGFFVYDTNDNQVAEVKGDWKGWNFRFIGANAQQIGIVTKKWAGLGKELFTSADNYIISLEEACANQAKSMLLIAAGLAIDIVFKEKK